MIDVLLAEVGPVGVGEDVLGVGGLPEQEVGDPVVAAGTDNQVRVGEFSGVEVVGEHALADVVRVNTIGDHSAHGVDQLGS